MNKIKTTRNSETIMTEVVCPNDTNPMGILLGGKLVQWMDIASAVCAQNHAEQICVTASIGMVNFKASATLGEIITVKAKVTRAFKTSMEIGVKVWSKKVLEKNKRLINEAYFTFVAIDENASPVAVPGLKPLTAEEKSEYQAAGKRKENKKI
ncbi:MAG: acyl-CoA thioesterase [Crocinitomicaceae bacterium]